MEDVRNALKQTRQVMGQVRQALIAEAQGIADRAGSKAILVSRLADKYGISSLTAKRWLAQAGFELDKTRTGRPRYEDVLIHDGLLDQYRAIKARTEDPSDEG